MGTPGRLYVGKGLFVHLPKPKSYGDFTRRLASRWRYRMLIGALVVSTLPLLFVRTSPAAFVSLVLVALVFVWDAFARRCRMWDRYAAERELLQKILSVETVEAFYVGARDANRMPPNVDDLSFFGGRPAAEADPVHYLRYLWLRHLLNGALPTAGCRVLDLGCQYGLMTGLLGREGTLVVAADLNPESLKSLSRLRQRWAPVCADAKTLPFRAESFDLINFTEVLEHLSDPTATLAEIKRCLRPGGTVILTTDNRHGLLWGEWINPLCIGEKIAGLFFPQALPPPALVWSNDSLGLAFYHTNFSAHEIRALMDGVGFELARWCSYYHLGELHQVLSQFFPHWTESRIAGVLYRIDRMLNRIPVMRMLGMHWLIVGKKPAPSGG
jgi:2-polyprenyl-3-methyl-5-hydroxy-6-metoxy-1,4-benzoquinol methylase